MNAGEVIKGIVQWILFLIRSIGGFLKIGKLRKYNKYQLVFDTNIPKSTIINQEDQSHIFDDSKLGNNKKISQIKDSTSNYDQRRVSFSNIYLGIITLSIFLIGLSMFYYFFWRPYQKESNLQHCLIEAENTLESKKTNIEKEKEILQDKRNVVESEVEEKRIEFKNSNPEPVKQEYTNFGSVHRIRDLLSDPWYAWSKDYENLSYPLKEISWKIDGLKKDSEIIKTEKEDQDEKCYRLYRPPDFCKISRV